MMKSKDNPKRIIYTGQTMEVMPGDHGVIPIPPVISNQLNEAQQKGIPTSVSSAPPIEVGFDTFRQEIFISIGEKQIASFALTFKKKPITIAGWIVWGFKRLNIFKLYRLRKNKTKPISKDPGFSYALENDKHVKR